MNPYEVAYEWLRLRPHVWLATLAAVTTLLYGFFKEKWPKDAFTFALFFTMLGGVYGGLCLVWENHTDVYRGIAAAFGTAWCANRAWRALTGDDA